MALDFSGTAQKYKQIIVAHSMSMTANLNVAQILVQLMKEKLPAHGTKYILLAAWCKHCFILGELHKKVTWIESYMLVTGVNPSTMAFTVVMVPMTGYVPFWLTLTLHSASDLVLLFLHCYEKAIMILFLHLNVMPLIIWGNVLAPLVPLIKWSNNTVKIELLS